MSIKEKFHITGLFYELKGYKFRKYLNIIKKGSSVHVPDLLIVMMNPGASRPLDGIDNNTLESEAVPDRTQSQIMKVMTACKLQYARVLNLTDLREPKSNKMFLKVLEMDKKGIPHSVFDDRRKEDFESLFIRGVAVLYAWGVGKELKDLAEMAIHRINDNQAVGLKKEGVDWAYYHPLPQVYKKQVEWANKIIKLLNNYENQETPQGIKKII